MRFGDGRSDVFKYLAHLLNSLDRIVRYGARTQRGSTSKQSRRVTSPPKERSDIGKFSRGLAEASHRE